MKKNAWTQNVTVGICGKNQSHVTHCLGVKKLIQNVILDLNGNNLLLIQIVAPSALIVAHVALMVAATALIVAAAALNSSAFIFFYPWYKESSKKNTGWSRGTDARPTISTYSCSPVIVSSESRFENIICNALNKPGSGVCDRARSLMLDMSGWEALI